MSVRFTIRWSWQPIVSVVVLGLVATAWCDGATTRGRSGARSWSGFCEVARAVDEANHRSGELAGAATFERRLRRQLSRLAAASPSKQLRAELRTATPVFVRPYARQPVTLTGRRLAAVDAVDTALHDHCALGRAIFDTSASTPISTLGPSP